jgi:ketosteroid isomerase-like protein
MALALAAAPEAAVEQAEKNWAAGITKQDFALLGKVLADDLVYTHSTGSVDTKQSYIEALKSGKSKYFSVDYDELKSRSLGKDTAVVTARLRVRVLSNGQPTDMKLSILHVFALRGGQWQLVAHQSARLP